MKKVIGQLQKAGKAGAGKGKKVLAQGKAAAKEGGQKIGQQEAGQVAGAVGVALGQPGAAEHHRPQHKPEDYEPRVQKVFGFEEFEEPREINEPTINDAHAKHLAENADLFFGKDFDPEEVEHIFYEETEMEFLKDTYGKISPLGESYFKTLEAFRKAACHNDAVIAMHLPLTLSLIFIAASLFLGYCVVGSSVPSLLAPLSDLKVSLIAQGGVLAALVMVYLFAFKIPYINSQRISVVNFDNYVQSISNFTRTQFTLLKEEYLKVEQRLGQNTDDVLKLSRDYSAAITWVMFASFLLRCSVRNTLFHHRRNLALWKFAGILVILLLTGGAIWLAFGLQGESSFLTQAPVWNLAVMGGGVVILLALLNGLSNQANRLPDTWMDITKWKLFGSNALGLLKAVTDLAAAEKTKIIQFRDRYAGGGGAAATQ